MGRYFLYFFRTFSNFNKIDKNKRAFLLIYPKDGIKKAPFFEKKEAKTAQKRPQTV